MRPAWHGELTVWRRIRRYAVPRRMIEEATERRLAGDWRGACAAANVDVGFDLDRVADEHGVTDVDRLADDLRHLVPDLLRWHLPRQGCGRTTILNRTAVALARYGDATLYVATPLYVNGSQRLRLTFDRDDGHPGAPVDWTDDRHLFDDRFCGDLLRHAGGGPDRAPFLHPDGTPLAEAELPSSDPGPEAGATARAEWSLLLFERGEIEAAFDAAGLGADLGFPEGYNYEWRDGPRETIARMPVSPPLMARAAARAAERGADVAVFEIGRHRALVVGREDGGDRPLVRAGNTYRTAGVHLAEHHWRRSVDAELVRRGMVAPDELHPLVRSALFPARPAADGPVGPPGPALPEPVRVRCKGEWHEVRSSGGDLEIPHSEEERRREDALRAFGGAVSGCFAVRQAWRTGEGRLPRGLREQRRELFLRVQHGDTDGVLALLDAGVDPRVRDGGRRRTLMHQLYVMDHETMLPILLKAGLGLEDVDHHGRTPLHVAVGDMGSAGVVRALREAGARTDVTDDNGMDLDDLIEWREREDLDFLDD